jgi:hypothetical protein
VVTTNVTPEDMIALSGFIRDLGGGAGQMSREANRLYEALVVAVGNEGKGDEVTAVLVQHFAKIRKIAEFLAALETLAIKQGGDTNAAGLLFQRADQQSTEQVHTVMTENGPSGRR